MAKFVIGSLYRLKGLPKVYYLGDQAGVLCFKDMASGQTYEFLSDADLETPAPKPVVEEPVVEPVKPTTKGKR